jgi:serine phosphatase RsbU (regulator of sigma subunit)
MLASTNRLNWQIILPQRHIIILIIIGLILALAVPFLINLSWSQGRFAHVAFELYCVLTGASIFYISFSKFRLVKDKISLFLSLAFLSAGIIDLPHALSFRPFSSFFGEANLSIYAWYLSRLILALFFIYAISGGLEARVSKTYGYQALLIVSLVSILITIAPFLILRTQFLNIKANQMLVSLLDLVAIILFLVSFFLFERIKPFSKTPLYSWVGRSMIFAALANFYHFYSKSPEDLIFVLAYALKAVSYTAIVLGLHLEYLQLYKRDITALEREIKLAAEVQRHFLPAQELKRGKIQGTARQLQARIVGGDWYDHYYTNEHFLVSVGDASGKGIYAALLATMVQSHMRSVYIGAKSLESALSKINEEILQEFGEEHFATLLVAEVKPDTGVIRIINCGHEQPLLYKEQENGWQITETSSTVPLGIDSQLFKPKSFELTLQPGDKLLIYTDGLRDNQNLNKERFSLERVLEVLNRTQAMSIKNICDKLIENLLDFCEGNLSDDVTLLGLEMLKQPDSTTFKK